MIEVVDDAFDSQALGGPVFKARFAAGAPGDLDGAARDVLRDVAGRDAVLVSVFAPCTSELNTLLQGLGFSLVSVRCAYERPVPAAPEDTRPPRGVTLRRLSEGLPAVPADDVSALAAVLGATSRYFKDGNIPRDRAAGLYETWITNSLRHGYAAEAILAYEGARLVGMNTLRFDGPVGAIDLIGVQASHQGQGLGQQLMHEGFSACLARGATHVRVVTEAENVGASRFYQRHGFLLVTTDLVWHKHPRSAAGYQPGLRDRVEVR